MAADSRRLTFATGHAVRRVVAKLDAPNATVNIRGATVDVPLLVWVATVARLAENICWSPRRPRRKSRYSHGDAPQVLVDVGNNTDALVVVAVRVDPDKRSRGESGVEDCNKEELHGFGVR